MDRINLFHNHQLGTFILSEKRKKKKKWKEITLLLSSKWLILFDYSGCGGVACCQDHMAANVIVCGVSNFRIALVVLTVIIRYDGNMYPVHLVKLYNLTQS